MFQSQIQIGNPERPIVFFTVRTVEHPNPGAIRVLEKMRISFAEAPSDEIREAQIIIFDNVDEVAAFFRTNDSARAVAVFDGRVARRFSPTFTGRSGAQFPVWSRGAMWGIAINSEISDTRATDCANQARAWYGKNFRNETLPWGPTRRGEIPPTVVTLPNHAAEIVRRLNEGPDMAASISDEAYARDIPDGTRISWTRVPIDPATYPRKKMMDHLAALAAFERACAQIVTRPGVKEAILAGVELDPMLPRLVDCYLHPRHGDTPVQEWSVRRPDMHVSGDDLSASENDEMPGGFVDVFHIDRAYRINADPWSRCLDFLFERGLLVFVVSSGWSATYIDSTRWMVETLQSEGYDVEIVTTDDLHRLTVTDESVLLDGRRVGTIWRQFPVFETTGGFADLVFAANDGKVRMVPEFAHFGNKTWFSLFWMMRDAFAALISPEQMAILQKLIPESHLLVPGSWDRPFRIVGIDVRGIEGLVNMDQKDIAQLVLKITGANDKAARSYGVLVGGARSREDWQCWIRDRIERHEPFIVQRRFMTSIEEVAVMNLANGAPERFRCRVLQRPWVVGDELVSVHTCCTPSHTTVIHGRVDMAVQPIIFT